MPTVTTIADALFTKTRQRVLGLLYGHPERRFYTNEIMRLANMGRGTIQRELDRLSSADLLLVTRVGNQMHYQANMHSARLGAKSSRAMYCLIKFSTLVWPGVSMRVPQMFS